MVIDHLSENPLYNTECVYITGWMSQTVIAPFSKYGRMHYRT